MSIGIIIIFIIIIVIIYVIQKDIHEKSIEREVQLCGGVIISIEHKVLDKGPFVIAGKGSSIYRFIYRVGDETKEGWVKFGGLLGPKWKM